MGSALEFVDTPVALDVLAYFGHDIVSSDPETIFSIYRDLTLTSLVTYSVADVAWR